MTKIQKKSIAELIMLLTDYKKVEFTDLYEDSKNIDQLVIGNADYVIDINSEYSYTIDYNYVDSCLESSYIVPELFEIQNISNIYVDCIGEEIELTDSQEKTLIELLEKAVRYKFGIKNESLKTA